MRTIMETLLAQQVVSVTDFRQPTKVHDMANNKPVAIMNRNQVMGYYVPLAAIENIQIIEAKSNEIEAARLKRKERIAGVLKYLEDK